MIEDNRENFNGLSPDEKIFIENYRNKYSSRAKYYRIRRLSIWVGSICAILLPFVFIGIEFYREGQVNLKSSILNSVLAICTIVVLIGTVLIRYLQTSTDKKVIDDGISQLYFEELVQLRYNYEQLKNESGRGKETEINIGKIIDDYINSKFTEEYIQEKIAANFKEEATKNKKIDELIRYIEKK